MFQLYPDAVVGLKLTARHYVRRLLQPIELDADEVPEYEPEDEDEFLTQVQIAAKKRKLIEEKLAEKREAQVEELKSK